MINDGIHKIPAHNTSVGSDPKFSHTSFNVKAIINHHKPITSCTLHNSTSFESLLLPMFSTGESLHHACHTPCSPQKTQLYWMCINAENERRYRYNKNEFVESTIFGKKNIECTYILWVRRKFPIFSSSSWFGSAQNSLICSNQFFSLNHLLTDKEKMW